MKHIASSANRAAKASLVALGLAAVSLPVAGALATAQDSGAQLTAEQVDSARATFKNFSCSACHQLSDAGASGQIGPSLDGDATLEHDFIVNRVTNGQGAMPGFGGQISDEEIDQLASYILQVKK